MGTVAGRRSRLVAVAVVSVRLWYEAKEEGSLEGSPS